MPQYSLSGYLQALSWRSKKTLLVEGPSDKKVIARVIAGFEEDSSQAALPSLLIDTAEIIKGEPPAVVGNRMIVEAVQKQAQTNGLRMAALVDREYRDFVLDPPIADKNPRHVVVNATCFWTRGHSLENYFIDDRFILLFLAHQFAERLPSGWRERISAVYRGILTWSVSASIAFHKTSLLEKASGVIQIQCWRQDPSGNLLLDFGAIASLLLPRQVSASQLQTLQQQLTSTYNALSPLVSSDILQWLAHGHIGYESVWSGIGFALASLANYSEDLGKDVANGFREEKLRFAATSWSNFIKEGIVESPTELWNWMKTA